MVAGFGWARVARASVLCAALVALASPRTSARAEPPMEAAEIASDEPSGYRTLINDAVREYNLRHFDEARGLFTRAHALFPNARTLRGLGATSFELRDYVESVRMLEAALASTVRPLDVPLRERTARLLARARGFVGTVALDVVPSATVTVLDGVPMPETRQLLLAVGDHVLEFRAPGYLSELRKLRIDGGESERIEVHLSRPPEASPPAPLAPQQPPHTERHLYKSGWLWAAVGTAVAAAAIGAGLALRSDERYDGGSEHVVVGR